MDIGKPDYSGSKLNKENALLLDLTRLRDNSLCDKDTESLQPRPAPAHIQLAAYPKQQNCVEMMSTSPEENCQISLQEPRTDTMSRRTENTKQGQDQADKYIINNNNMTADENYFSINIATEKVPLFANSDSNESESGDEDKPIFAEDTDTSSEDFDRDEVFKTEDFPSYSSKATCQPLPTIYAATFGTKDQSKNSVKQKRFFLSCDCENKCDDAAEELNADVIAGIKRRLSGVSLTETKNKLLNYVKAQDEVHKRKNESFFFAGHGYCVTAFSQFVGVSRYILRKVLEANERGLVKFVHNNTRSMKYCARKINAMCWFQGFSDIYGQKAPDVQIRVLPSWLNATSVYEMYKQENPLPGEQIKFSTFCKMLSEDFGPRRNDRSLPQVRFSKYSTHSVCNECSDLDAFQQTCRTEEDISLCRALKFKHRERFSRQQRCITSMRHLSQTFPDQYLSIYIDGMDNMKSHIPRFLEKTKKLANFWKLPSKITGSIIYSSHYPLNRKVKMFLNFDQYEQGLFLIYVITRLGFY